MEKPLMISHLEKSMDFTLFDCKWIPKTAHFTIVGSKTRGSGVIQVLEVAPSELTTIKEIETQHAIKCSTFGASGYGKRNLATGDFVGNLDIWDLETSLKVYNVKAHNEIINAIDGIGGVTCGSPEIATGSKDGSVKVWDIRQKERPVAIIQNPDGENQRDCWAVGFGNTYNNEERMLCSGYDNGDVKLFDLKTMKLVWEHNVTNGVCSIEFDRKDIPINKLLITTLESKFHIFDCRTFHPLKGYSCLTEKAHNSTIWSIKHLPQDRDIFMTTGGSGSLCLWRYKYPEARVKRDVSDGKDVGVMGTVELLQNSTLSTQPISSFAWSPDKKGLGVSTSFDQCVRLIIVTKLNLY